MMRVMKTNLKESPLMLTMKMRTKEEASAQTPFVAKDLPLHCNLLIAVPHPCRRPLIDGYLTTQVQKMSYKSVFLFHSSQSSEALPPLLLCKVPRNKYITGLFCRG